MAGWRRHAGHGKGWLQQPALHFALIGVTLLGLDWLRARPDEPSVVSPVDEERALQRLRDQFETSRGRAMTPSEEAQALADFRYEQGLFQTALELGMHETDPIVRRRLVQRMEFLIEDMVSVPQATDEELLALIESEPGQFPVTQTLSFEHRFFARSVHGKQSLAAARSARAQLEEGQSAPGEKFVRRLHTDAVRLEALVRAVGPKTAKAMFEAPLGSWSDPIPSAYGYHLVRVTERSTSSPRLADVREKARAAWQRRERERVGRELIASLHGGS